MSSCWTSALYPGDRSAQTALLILLTKALTSQCNNLQHNKSCHTVTSFLNEKRNCVLKHDFTTIRRWPWPSLSPFSTLTCLPIPTSSETRLLVSSTKATPPILLLWTMVRFAHKTGYSWHHFTYFPQQLARGRWFEISLVCANLSPGLTYPVRVKRGVSFISLHGKLGLRSWLKRSGLCMLSTSPCCTQGSGGGSGTNCRGTEHRLHSLKRISQCRREK